jgi:hypothetical protein
MEKRGVPCAWGDCPGLNHGPTSREHEERFSTKGRTEGQMIKNGAAALIIGGSESNRAN